MVLRTSPTYPSLQDTSRVSQMAGWILNFCGRRSLPHCTQAKVSFYPMRVYFAANVNTNNLHWCVALHNCNAPLSRPEPYSQHVVRNLSAASDIGITSKARLMKRGISRTQRNPTVRTLFKEGVLFKFS